MRLIDMNYNDYLAHHGVKGMKWGVRRYQNPDGSLTSAGKRRMRKKISSYRKSLISEENYQKRKKEIETNTPSIDNSRKIKALTKQANDLARKYNFDQDDGGGGKTEADRKAGKKYMQLWEEIHNLELEQEPPYYSRSSHAKYVNNQLIKKYGEKTLNEAYDTRLWKLAEAYINAGSYEKKWKAWQV